MSDILRIASLSHAFSGTRVLDEVAFSLPPGERLAVLGASGSGKTTLLRLIAGLEAPTAGHIEIAGRAVSRAGEVLVAPQNREVALVFQGLALFPHLRALDQICFAARGRGGRRRAEDLLARIGLAHRAGARLDELSGGERQRIALARALAQEPKLLLMDEPFASLDDDKRAEMRDLLRSLLEKTETTLILVTHSRHDALDLARRVLVLQAGRPAAYDLLETVLTRPRHAAAVRALGLGQLIEGQFGSDGQAATAFGKVAVSAGATPGRVSLFVRPAQPRIVSDGDGVEAEVVSLELRPPEQREVQRVAVVRVASSLLRVFADGQALAAGERIRVRIEGECDVVEE
jgi:ABC-type sulfate/molybdate transport systems ATPase subunit